MKSLKVKPAKTDKPPKKTKPKKKDTGKPQKPKPKSKANKDKGKRPKADTAAETEAEVPEKPGRKKRSKRGDKWASVGLSAISDGML